MTVADLTPIELYSIIIFAIVVGFYLPRLAWNGLKDRDTPLSPVQWVIVAIGLLGLFGAPIVIALGAIGS